jgi:hypothetical protein
MSHIALISIGYIDLARVNPRNFGPLATAEPLGFTDLGWAITLAELAQFLAKKSV